MSTRSKLFIAAFLGLSACANTVPKTPSEVEARATVEGSQEIEIHESWDQTPVGSARIEERHIQSVMTLQIAEGDAAPQNHVVEERSLARWRTDVLATSTDGKRQKWRALYLDRHERSIIDGTPTDTSGAVLGKSYVVDLGEGRTTITRDDGKAVSDAEREEIFKDQLTKKKKKKSAASPKAGPGGSPSPSPSPAKFPARPIRIGESVASYANFLASDMSEGEENATAKDTRAKLVAIRTVDGEPCAVFAIALTANIPNFSAIPMTGTSTVRARDGAEVDVEIAGKIHADGKHLPQTDGRKILFVDGETHVRVVHRPAPRAATEVKP